MLCCSTRGFSFSGIAKWPRACFSESHSRNESPPNEHCGRRRDRSFDLPVYWPLDAHFDAARMPFRSAVKEKRGIRATTTTTHRCRPPLPRSMVRARLACRPVVERPCRYRHPSSRSAARRTAGPAARSDTAAGACSPIGAPGVVPMYTFGPAAAEVAGPLSLGRPRRGDAGGQGFAHLPRRGIDRLPLIPDELTHLFLALAWRTCVSRVTAHLFLFPPSGRKGKPILGHVDVVRHWAIRRAVPWLVVSATH